METLNGNVLLLLAVLLGSIFEVQHGISGEEGRRVGSLSTQGRVYGILPRMHPTAQLLIMLSDLPLKVGILLND